MSQSHEAHDADFLHAVLDAVPALLMVVDSDVRIRHLNAASASGLGLERGQVLDLRGGEALHCLHAQETPGGCGCAPACRGCVIRNAVGEARNGGRTVRQAARMIRVRDGRRSELHLMVSASPLPGREGSDVLLAVEDVGELVRLRGLLPICMYCKRVRDDTGYWEEVAGYLEERLEVQFTHSLCPDCHQRVFPEAGPPAEQAGA
jgi:PAS domain-containing protein